MTTAAPSTALVTIQPAFTDPERLALAGFLAGYRGLTREAYALDLRQFTTWCRTRSLPLFAVRRADIEGFARDLEARGRGRATVTRRLSTIAGFYKYAVEEEILDHSPAAHVRRPRVDYESSCHCLGPQRARRPAGGCRARVATRACADLAARAERAAGLGGHRCRHRAPGPGTWPPDADDHPQGRQGLSPSRSRPAPPGQSTWPPANAATAPSSSPLTGAAWTDMAPGGSSARWRAAPGSPNLSARTRSGKTVLAARASVRVGSRSSAELIR